MIWERFQETLEPLRDQLNRALGTEWEEWEIPRESKEDWPAVAKALHADWWKQRIARQKKIDASIANNADYEYLYDKPYEDKKNGTGRRTIHGGKSVPAPRLVRRRGRRTDRPYCARQSWRWEAAGFRASDSGTPQDLERPASAQSGPDLLLRDQTLARRSRLRGRNVYRRGCRL